MSNFVFVILTRKVLFLKKKKTCIKQMFDGKSKCVVILYVIAVRLANILICFCSALPSPTCNQDLCCHTRVLSAGSVFSYAVHFPRRFHLHFQVQHCQNRRWRQGVEIKTSFTLLQISLPSKGFQGCYFYGKTFTLL